MSLPLSIPILLHPQRWWEELICHRTIEAESIRSLSFTALFSLPAFLFQKLTDQNSPIEFHISVHSMSRQWVRERIAATESGIGELKFYGRQLPDEFGPGSPPMVGGWIAVDDLAFADLWQRAQLPTAHTPYVTLYVVGLVPDQTPGGEDYWDISANPDLQVVDVRFRFGYEVKGSNAKDA